MCKNSELPGRCRKPAAGLGLLQNMRWDQGASLRDPRGQVPRQQASGGRLGKASKSLRGLLPLTGCAPHPGLLCYRLEKGEDGAFGEN